MSHPPIAILLGGLLACTALRPAGSGADAAPAPGPGSARSPAAAPSAPSATGSIQGTVVFEGEPPERRPLVRDTDPYCDRVAKLSEDVVVTQGKLKDVLVRIKNGTAGAHAPPAQPAVIDQQQCMYTPRVLGIVAGQRIVARNSDGTFHTVHGTRGGKLLWNLPQAAGAPELSIDPGGRAGDVIDIVCDVHPWMHAYAVVHDHPYFAVTGADGTFAIRGVPPGTYTLEAWHPTLGARAVQVKVSARARATPAARITYRP
jgi:plastocyanin